MTQWFPLPWISGFVFVGWLMVSGEITLLNVLTAILLAWLLPKLSRRFMPAVSSAGSLLAINRLIWVVIGDIIKSNIIVARLVLGDPTQLRSVFVTVPVDTDHPLVINLLASIITMTPGTVSVRVHEPAQSPDGNTDSSPGASIVVHALDCDDDDALIAEIKNRYENPLMEIFGCSPLR